MPSMAVALPDDPETLKAMLIAERLRDERLEGLKATDRDGASQKDLDPNPHKRAD